MQEAGGATAQDRMSSGKPYTPLHPIRQARQLLRRWLETEAVVLMDGALGTELLRRQARHLPELASYRPSVSPRGRKRRTSRSGCRDDSFQSAPDIPGPALASHSNAKPLGEMLAALTVCQPNWVKTVHRDYLRAGARCLLTNTFLAWPRSEGTVTLRYYRHLNRVAVQIAREVASDSWLVTPVIASIGPWPDDSPHSVEGCIRQLRSLQEADALLLETQTSLAFLEAVLDRVYESPARPVFVSFTFRRHGRRLVTWPHQHTPEEIADWAQQRRAIVHLLGVNCGYQLEPEDFIQIVRRYRQRTDLPILVRPHAGTPIFRRGQAHYPRHREFLEGALAGLVEAGARWLGGCCGSTPRDIAAMRKLLSRLAPSWGLQLA